jgi:uncharacterized membrane protein
MSRRRHPYADPFVVKLLRIKIVERAFSGSESRVARLLSMILVLSIATLSLAIETIALPNAGEKIPEFHIIGANGTIGSYAIQYQLREQKSVTVGIVNLV